jgi:hypothetical protein
MLRRARRVQERKYDCPGETGVQEKQDSASSRKVHVPMQQVRGVVHRGLQRPIEVWVRFGAGAKAHVLAKVVAAIGAILASVIGPGLVFFVDMIVVSVRADCGVVVGVRARR